MCQDPQREAAIDVSDEARKMLNAREEHLRCLLFKEMKNGNYYAAGRVMRIRDRYIIGVATRYEEEWDEVWRIAQRSLDGLDGA